jgi:hypothetical protein
VGSLGRFRGGLVALAIVGLAALLAAVPAIAVDPVPLLPDLDPIAPTAIAPMAATDGSGAVYLTFTFTLDNKGAGPAIVRGSRASTAVPTMTAAQVIKNMDGSFTTIPNVGELTWLPDIGYKRWGYQHQSYELYAADGSPAGTAPLVGLCLEDNRNTPGSSVPGEPTSKVYFGGCGKNKANLLAIDLGLSIGWRNLHSATRKGQLIPITTLPSGQYVLVNRVNSAGRLTESNTANNASSARISITWVEGQSLPTVQLLASCANTASCP